MKKIFFTIFGNFFLKSSATLPNCGKSLIANFYYFITRKLINTRGNDLGHSKNEMDWVIRSQALNCVIASI